MRPLAPFTTDVITALTILIVVFVMIFFVTGCEAPSVEESIVFIDVETEHQDATLRSTGFRDQYGKIRSICHALNDAKTITLSNFDREDTVAIDWWCDPKTDTAIIIPADPSLWAPLPAYHMGRGWRRGCVYGRDGRAIQPLCGLFRRRTLDAVTIGITAAQGMSGVPCVIDDKGALKAFGVISEGFTADPNEVSHIGTLRCRAF